ncbi:leucine-rich repeat protein kinase family protein [Actinidia rufa]|uniref:Leucine-rich repeat protein kinase family protein n=1 Tax=Actinidia rufa TaxID=165716 RepID=A0A7J0E292_9ERIC|nr:leucine-rich repeat protein kinase family protein [Actinidia rufa]
MNSIALGLVSFLTLSILSLLLSLLRRSISPRPQIRHLRGPDPGPRRLELTGYLPSELGAILSLQHLSLSNNNFSSLIPSHLFNSLNILSLDLSRNSLSGPIPPQISYLQNLSHLDLSSNLLNGSLPDGLSNLTHFAGTLNLSYNRFSGEIPPSYGRFPVMVSLDLRHNNLTGKIPQVGSLLNQGPTAFSGNPSLCGFPLQTPCPDPEAQNPRILSNPENPINPNSQTGFVGREKGRNGSVAVPIISVVSAVIGVFFLSAWVYRKKWTSGDGKIGREKLEKEVDGEEEEGQKGKFVAVDEELGLELEDLLRASAYVVGKSRSGIVYKVVGRGSGVAGVVVAVRRLSECNTTWRLKEFEAEVEAVSRVQHPNMVRLRAYYYASDEKLLVSDFIGNGSLYTALHGGPAETSPPLSWSARLRIAQGIARGLAHIHECSPRKHVHGNLKSSKILLDNDLKPYISGFGLTRLVSGTSKSTNAALKTHNLNIILTGRFPGGGLENDGKGLENLVRKVFREERPLSEIIDPALVHEVHTKKQVVAAFHTALNCTELDPEVRPRMRTISESLDRIESQ